MTFQKAREHSVKTARLPIQEYMVRCQNGKNYHSEILAINQGTADMAHTLHVLVLVLLLCIVFKYKRPLKQPLPPPPGTDVLRFFCVPFVTDTLTSQRHFSFSS